MIHFVSKREKYIINKGESMNENTNEYLIISINDLGKKYCIQYIDGKKIKSYKQRKEQVKKYCDVTSLRYIYLEKRIQLYLSEPDFEKLQHEGRISYLKKLCDPATSDISLRIFWARNRYDLTILMNDPEWRVRYEVAKNGYSLSIGHLAELVSDPCSEVRNMAMRRLYARCR